MARKPKKRTSPKKTQKFDLGAMRSWIQDRFSARGHVLGKALCWFVLVAAVVVGGAAGMNALQRYALAEDTQVKVKYSVELESLPAWMPASLGRYILADVTPQDRDFDDPNLCRSMYERARENPWIAEVKEIRRIRLSPDEGIVRMRGRYRQPIARIAWQGRRTHYVDGQGVVLPYSQVPKWGAKDADGPKYFIHRDAVPANLQAVRIHYSVIEGVEAVPVGVGQTWPGGDLAQGLRLAQLLSSRPYANQIAVVDVRNHARRISESEPELCLYAQQGQGKPTEIRFGRFPHPNGGDWVISPARKVKYLDEYVHDQNGRLAGVHSYIDVRFDELRVSLN